MRQYIYLISANNSYQLFSIDQTLYALSGSFHLFVIRMSSINEKDDESLQMYYH